MSQSPSKHFVAQRFTAMIQVPLVIWLVISVLMHLGADRAEFQEWIGGWRTAALMIIFVLSVFYHMRLGMGDVIDDYIHKPGSRSTLQMVNTVVALVLGATAVFSIIAITLIV